MTSERRCPTLMVQGTASDVGKSLIVTALCRIFTNEGFKTAPFKSQNMSLNSYVTPDGKEIGRAQAVQADACRVPATTDMNPILLKPTGERRSQVVVHGKPLRDYDAVEYREKYLPTAQAVVVDALNRLRTSHDLVVMEGAGSPAEVNLRDRDVVNMRAAAWGEAPVLLVADIDRGGVFASIVGTMAILRPDERDRVRGFIINKFRGDPALLKDGLDWLEAETGKPVLGVVPVLPDVGLEDEDSASLADKLRRNPASADPDPAAEPRLDIAVLRLPRMSNFTDFDAIAGEPDALVRYVDRPERLGRPDALLLPGTKNAIQDLQALRESGLADAVLAYAAAGGHVAGICGGYQLLGSRLSDPEGFESSETAGADIEALGLLPAETVYLGEKRTERVRGVFAGWQPGASAPDAVDIPIEGYEIHMGVTTFRADVHRPFRLGADAVAEGAAAADGRVWGTYLHGVFDNDEFRRTWLNRLREHKGWTARPNSGYRHRERREAAFDRLAAHVEKHVNMNAIYEIVGYPSKKREANLHT
ncbi:cobyric acid synthase [Paenibacillus sp. TRM 82003]|nr:cobyric acid synthase [Paenibacillus sp. TRM 82003]